MPDMYIDGVLVTTINPEALPAAQKNLARLIVKMARDKKESS
jgi:hypothetical protein